MRTLYRQRATIATPAAQIPNANKLALCLGESSADDKTFTSASYQDAQGNLYSVASTVTKPIFAELTGQQYGERQELTLNVRYATAADIDTLRIDTAELEVRNEIIPFCQRET